MASEPAKGERSDRGEKMGTIYGVFIPTTLNVLSILMYLRVASPITSGFVLTGSMGLFWDR